MLVNKNHSQLGNMNWISTDKKLPEDHKWVLVDGGIGYIRQGEWWTITGERYPGKLIQWPVTHWMPLPILTDPTKAVNPAQTESK